MTKRFADKDTYNFISKSLRENGISDAIIITADRMNINLLHVFYEKILNVKDKFKLSNNIDIIVKTLLGIYGNYVATYYYYKLGYDVKNEYSVYENGSLVTRADIAFTDHDGNLNLCEVKACRQIIDNIRNYNSNGEKKYNDKYFYDMDKDIIKYKEIGNKLVLQASRLARTNNKVTVIIFDGCFMDDIIRDKINKLGANIFRLAVNINDLEDQIYDMVFKIADDLKSVKVSKNTMGEK